MHRRLYDLDLQLEDMARAGVDLSVLSCLLGWSAPLDECRFINDDLAAIEENIRANLSAWRKRPFSKADLDELRRVTITSQVNSLALDSPRLYDTYETLCALNVPVFVHPALVPTGYEHLKDYDLPRVLGREVDLTVATTRLIAGGIFDRFPNLKVVIAHFGGGIAAVKDRLVGKGYRFGTLKKPFSEYYEGVYFDMAGFEGGAVALNCTLQEIRPERLVFASDYPRGFYRCEYRYRQRHGCLEKLYQRSSWFTAGAREQDQMLGGTAAALLKL